MRLTFKASCSKELAFTSSNEDKFEFNSAESLFALSDGASESYNSKLWAKILVKNFVKTPIKELSSIEECIKEYEANEIVSSLSWSKQLAYERGSFATLLGVEYLPQSATVNILAIGDSLALLVDDGRVVESWPFTSPDSFLLKPTLLSSRRDYNLFVSENDFIVKNTKAFCLSGLKNPLLLCMTDAIGEWTLKGMIAENNNLSRLCDLTSTRSFFEIVIQERHAKRMKIDDTTLVKFSFNEVL